MALSTMASLPRPRAEISVTLDQPKIDLAHVAQVGHGVASVVLDPEMTTC